MILVLSQGPDAGSDLLLGGPRKVCALVTPGTASRRQGTAAGACARRAARIRSTTVSTPPTQVQVIIQCE